ncbi:unnamed protein product [Ostreobium quekettii]|uniref:PX domain-containing protein n=1 Tax=Ostreobium quekettii TaxID=121088 RepID=A0A8S1JAP8_9CHLO|nr:unnamed protein product [Ostreobium quekettii]
MTAAGARQRVAAPSAVLVLRRMSNTLVKLAAAAYILAWALSFTSNRPLWNLPVAVLAVVAFRWMSGRVVVAPRDGAAALRRVPRRYAGGSSWQGPRPAIGPEEGRDRDAWRRGVNAPIVESAWDALCGSVVQEFVYDSWYMSLTPDRDFPAEVRRLLNEAFADVAQRARKIDLRTVLLRELCDLFLDHLDLYRRTKQGVGLLNEGHLTPAARDRAFQQEMKTEGTLHPSMCSRDGHYRVIRCIAESIVSCSVSKCDLARPYVKALSRELVATCVLRPVLMYFNRYNASRLVLSMFPEELEQIQAKIAKRMEELVGKKELMNGHFEFEERARRAAELEAKAHKKYKYRQSRTPNHQHKEASSAEELPAEGSSVAGKSRGVDDPCEDEGTLGGEESSNRDDNASEASSALTEQRSVVSDPLSTASAPSPSRCPTCCRAPEIASPDAVGMDGMPGLATVGSSLDASSPGLQSANFEAQGEAYSSIVGWPRARVVAPEIKMDGSKEFVVFKIRVADDEGEWTVARRYRNFESLHKKLRDIPEYRALGAKLPPKHFLLQSKTTEFVQGRRVALDKYLQCVLSSGVLAFHPEVLNFLCKEHSGTYRPDADVSLLKTVASNADNVKHSLKTAVGDVLVEGKARLSGMTKSPVKRRGTSGPTRGSIPEASPNEMLPQHWSTGHLQDHPHVHFKQQDFRLSNTGQHSDALSPRAFSDGSGPLFSIGAASGTPIRDVGTPGEVGQVLNLHLSSSVPARREEQREAKGVYLRASSASTEGCLSGACLWISFV